MQEPGPGAAPPASSVPWKSSQTSHLSEVFVLYQISGFSSSTLFQYLELKIALNISCCLNSYILLPLSPPL